MTILNWAASVKPDLVRLQLETGIPALFAAAQFCHESYNEDTGGLAELAARCHNYGGMKWAPWQAEYGGSPVVYGTWEHIDGQDQRMDAAFGLFPSWQAWLQAYTALLRFDRYRGAFRYAADPLLFGIYVWQAGYATDPAYGQKLARWMQELWEEYADTLPGAPVARTEVPIRDTGGRLLATGWLEGDTTVVRLRELAEAQGLRVDWNQGERAAIVRFPGRP